MAELRADNNSLSPPSVRLAVGSVFAGRYRVESLLGEGATSAVYVARDFASEDENGASPCVALKVIHRHLLGDPQVFPRFRREALLLRRVTDAHVVRLRDFVEDDGLFALVLDLHDGQTLEHRLAEGPLPVADAVSIALQVLSALAVAHQAGIVHRDLKPPNVLVETLENKPLARVLDFGLAKAVHGDAVSTGLTEHDMICGTPEYMAPEQVRGDELDGRVDVYATGVMLYQMLTGKVPFTGRTPMAAMTAHLVGTLESPRALRPDGAVSGALAAVVMRALAREPKDRYPSAEAFAEALRELPLSETAAPLGTTTDLALGKTDLAHDFGVTERDVPRPEPNSARRVGPPTQAPLTLPVDRHEKRTTWLILAVFSLIAVVVGALLGSR